MKRALCLALCCLVTVMAGVPAIASGVMKSDVETILTTISTNVAQTEEIASSVQKIIAWQLEGSNEELAAYKEAVVNGTEYEDTGSSDEEIAAKADELDIYINRVSALRGEVDALQATGLTSVDKTIDAAKTYFSKLETALRDLMVIFDFYFAEQDAGQVLAEYNEKTFTDDAEAISELYYVIQQMTDAMDKIDCPVFMQECFDKYIGTTRKYLAVLETMYTAVQIEDVLRSTSASYLIGRMDIEIANCEIELTELFNLQYEKVDERLNGNIATLRAELVKNCETLMGAL